MTTTDMSLALLLGPQLRAFRDAGYEVLGASAPGPFVEGLEADGIGHVPLHHATRGWSLARDLRATRELRRSIRALRPDIVHTHNPKPGVYGRLAARAARVPLVVNTQHGLYATSDDRWTRRAVVNAVERLAAACSDIELVQNADDLHTLARLGTPRRKLTLLGNGVDLARFDPSTVDPAAVRARREGLDPRAGGVLVGAVGRLVAEKGFPELFEAMAMVRQSHPEARLVVAGPDDVDKADRLTAAEVARAEAGGVRFLGMVDDIEVVYAAMDLFVLPSHREGFSRSGMEAAAMGIPTVATDVRGCREVVDHGTTGLLVPPRRTDELAAAIAVLVADRDRRLRFGRAARAMARERFDQQSVIQRTLAAYEHLPRRRGATGLPDLATRPPDR